ncbi:MAG: 2-hydroxyacid dehydrogenase [Proteobacteria bacterium]|nr:2-hydroxyacid dehydrogenase [Pseudomonadota bacterium]
MRIVFHGSNAANFSPGFEAFLTESHDIRMLPDALTAPEDIAAFQAAEVIIGVKLTAADPRPAALRLYHAPAAGTDMIDAACLPKGAVLCNAFGHEQAIAEYVMAALLNRHVPLARADGRLREGHWDYWAGRPGALRTELGNQTIGLLGYGHIGKAIAERAKAFGMGISVANRTKQPVGGLVDASYGLEDLPAFMASADAIVVSLPLNEATRGFVNAPALAAMRPEAVIINVGRGPVIDEQALYDALAEKRIGGAIIDTWYQYPTPDAPTTLPSALPFQRLDNLVMTPHMSGWTNGTVRRRQQTIAENIARLAAGTALVNVVG